MFHCHDKQLENNKTLGPGGPRVSIVFSLFEIAMKHLNSCLKYILIHDKYEGFTDLLITAIDIYLPMRKIKQASADKAWITVKLKSLIVRRQAALHCFGKESDVFKRYRNIV